MGFGDNEAQEPKAHAEVALDALGTPGEDGIAEQAHGHTTGPGQMLSCNPLRCKCTQMPTEYSKNSSWRIIRKNQADESVNRRL